MQMQKYRISLRILILRQEETKSLPQTSFYSNQFLFR